MVLRSTQVRTCPRPEPKIFQKNRPILCKKWKISPIKNEFNLKIHKPNWRIGDFQRFSCSRFLFCGFGCYHRNPSLKTPTWKVSWKPVSSYPCTSLANLNWWIVSNCGFCWFHCQKTQTNEPCCDPPCPYANPSRRSYPRGRTLRRSWQCPRWTTSATPLD